MSTFINNSPSYCSYTLTYPQQIDADDDWGFFVDIDDIENNGYTNKIIKRNNAHRKLLNMNIYPDSIKEETDEELMFEMDMDMEENNNSILRDIKEKMSSYCMIGIMSVSVFATVIINRVLSK